MKVVATAMGFFEGRRVRPGTTLVVPDGFKGSWVARLDTAAAAAAKPKAPEKVAPKALSQIGRADAKSFNEVHDKPELA